MLCSGGPAFGFVFEDHAFEQGLNDLLFFWRELGDRFKLELKIAIGTALIGAEDQHICTHLESDREPVRFMVNCLDMFQRIGQERNYRKAPMR